MEFKRKVMDELLEWKKNNSQKKKALVIKGLRQIGKTFAARKFAQENYEHVVYINFKNNDDIKPVFERNFDIDRIIIDLSAMLPQYDFIPYKTVLIFDEIQECSNARASLKPFMEDGRFDVIATGSLLGIRGYNKKLGKGIPTGSEHFIEMKPMDFEEFLWAKGVKENVISSLKHSYETRKMISEPLHQQMLRYFSEYICVGGLPEVVSTFIQTSSIKEAYKVQKDIVEEYRDDFGKHLDDKENESVDIHLLSRIEEVFDAIPDQLAKENKKFQYSKLPNGGRATEYQNAIQWLIDAGIIVPCYNLSNLELPLEGNKIDNVFKLYFADSGLFVSLLEEGTASDILQGNLGIYKGSIFENIVADAFSKNNRKLYYFRKDNGTEIDFVIRYQSKPTLVEVKAATGNNKSSKSILSNYEKYQVDQCIKLGQYNIGFSNNVLTLPYYLAFLP